MIKAEKTRNFPENSPKNPKNLPLRSADGGIGSRLAGQGFFPNFFDDRGVLADPPPIDMPGYTSLFPMKNCKNSLLYPRYPLEVGPFQHLCSATQSAIHLPVLSFANRYSGSQ